jgi:hypothetical protein
LVATDEQPASRPYWGLEARNSTAASWWGRDLFEKIEREELPYLAAKLPTHRSRTTRRGGLNFSLT